MQKDEIKKLFVEGIDCSQVVLGQYAKELGISREMAYKIAAAFGGGMGQGETCGAIVGAMLVLGMKYGHERQQDFKQKKILEEKRGRFLQLFQKKYGGCSCKYLLGHDISNPEGLEEIIKENLLMDFCPEVVKDVLDILEQE